MGLSSRDPFLGVLAIRTPVPVVGCPNPLLPPRSSLFTFRQSHFPPFRTLGLPGNPEADFNSLGVLVRLPFTRLRELCRHPFQRLLVNHFRHLEICLHQPRPCIRTPTVISIPTPEPHLLDHHVVVRPHETMRVPHDALARMHTAPGPNHIDVPALEIRFAGDDTWATTSDSAVALTIQTPARREDSTFHHPCSPCQRPPSRTRNAPTQLAYCHPCPNRPVTCGRR